jgi:hypothetical protein
VNKSSIEMTLKQRQAFISGMTALKKEQFHYYCAFFAFSCIAKPTMAYIIK